MSRAVAAAVVALTLLGGCAQTAGSATLRPPGASRGPNRTTGVSATTGVSHQAIAWHRLRRVLAQTPVLPGSTAAPRAPVAVLKRATQTIGSPNFLQLTRWWTAPGTVSAALHYLKAHPPTGLRATGSGTGVAHGVVVKSLLFGGRSTEAYDQLTLVMAVTRRGDGVAVRADAEVVWIPRRTAAEHIDKTLTSVDVTATGPGAPPVRRTLTGHRARRLAAVVNALPVRAPGAYHCPNDLGYVDTLVFHVRGPDVVVHAEATGCTLVAVTVSGRRQPTLAGGAAVRHAVAAALRGSG